MMTTTTMMMMTTMTNELFGEVFQPC